MCNFHIFLKTGATEVSANRLVLPHEDNMIRSACSLSPPSSTALPPGGSSRLLTILLGHCTSLSMQPVQRMQRVHHTRHCLHQTEESGPITAYRTYHHNTYMTNCVCVYVCVCMCVCARACVCMHVCCKDVQIFHHFDREIYNIVQVLPRTVCFVTELWISFSFFFLFFFSKEDISESDV